MAKEEIINFNYFNFDIESCSFFRRFEVAVCKKIRQQTCCSYVLSYSSPLPCYGQKPNFHHLRKISAEKHNGRVNSEIRYRNLYNIIHVVFTSFKPTILFLNGSQWKYSCTALLCCPCYAPYIKYIKIGVENFHLIM